jgi:hypothetical protein
MLAPAERPRRNAAAVDVALGVDATEKVSELRSFGVKEF